jgi:uncharacterized protein with HEPN domain
MTRRDPRVPLRDMLDYSREALDFVRGRSRTEFEGDRLLSLAVTRLLAIVGEAAARTPEDVRAQLPAIPWARIIGMRNRLIHAYQAVDHEIVWDTLSNHLPPLIAELERAVAEIASGAADTNAERDTHEQASGAPDYDGPEGIHHA